MESPLIVSVLTFGSVLMLCHGLSIVIPGNGRLPATFLFATKVSQTLDQCARRCISLASCRSLGHNRKTELCELYMVENITISTDFQPSSDWVHISKQQWPQSVAGACENHTCGVTEVCLSKGTNWTCVQIKDTFHCISSPCQSGTCHETIDSFVCHCEPGYTGALCNEDILECASNPCLNSGACNELVNGYTCTCLFDYSGGHCETYRCTDFGSYRLCDGGGSGSPSSYMGRLEYYQGGVWGVICDDYWPGQYTSPFHDQNPVVACRTLGFSGGYARVESHFGSGNGPFYLTSAQCTGAESLLHHCPINTALGCDSREHVGVECY